MVFGGFDDAGEQPDEFVYVAVERLEVGMVYDFAFFEKFQPIGGFIRFFKGRCSFCG